MREWTAGLAVVLLAAGNISLDAAEDGALKGRRYTDGEMNSPLQDSSTSLGKPVWHDQTFPTASDEVVLIYDGNQGEFVAKDFKFRDGETLAELRLHYATLGKPARDAAGRMRAWVALVKDAERKDEEW
jgi:hypothetical protein